LGKHAYLIIAHNNFYILERLLKLLDDERNDIYLHIDKKTLNFDYKKFKYLLKKSNLYFCKRISVNWGGFSQVKCELLLLKKAVSLRYDYYHLISGVDLPLKSQNEIHTFFENKNGEFIHFCNESQADKEEVINRTSKYHFFQEYSKSKNKFIKTRSNQLNHLSLKVQNLLKINRNLKLQNKGILQYGSNWFSITHKFAEYVISKEKEIAKLFRFTICPDELFLQTLVYNSDFKNNLYLNKKDDSYKANMRLIDWQRGGPYTFRIDDFEELINSDRFFARKFDINIDRNIVDKISEYVLLKK
jgi:hypothetical protein